MPDSTYFDDQSLNKLSNKYEDIAGNPFVDALGFAKKFAGGVVKRVQQGATGAYSQADRALGGWLPGGGTPNPLTRGYDAPPENVAAIARSAGVSPDSFKFANLSRTRPLLNQLAVGTSQTGKNAWGEEGYAYRDPFVGPVIGLPESKMNRDVILHELGHLQGNQTPDFGRILQTASNLTGGFAPLKFMAGLAISSDAADEDKAEKFASKYGRSLTPLTSTGASEYGNYLRQEGARLKQEATQPIADVLSGLKSSYRNIAQASNVKDWLASNRSTDITDLKRSKNLREQLLSSGYTEQDLNQMFEEDLKRNPVKPLF